ncbi:SGNH hydrolase-type esterase domain containing protein [Parasponia andersonii]|uniref:SGNH hydrolase-type esterase domain containing protein n=1 Tax=Parasponia andersonii TaxID=3476 RepID=A0A2P5BA38_PARAD|nr:SGNH hydrolase-type esterase domain containing protein [Parasponia andersonii]
MAKMVSLVSLLFVLNLISPSFFFFSVLSEAHKLAPALYVFGSSAVDVGNNNKLRSFAKYDYLPYGIDFPDGASGRPTNGYNLVDYLAQSLGLEVPPPITSMNPSLSKNIDGIHDYSLTLLRNEKRNNNSTDNEAVHYAFSIDLVEKYVSHLEFLYRLGARKFVVFDAEAMGCLPYEVRKATPLDPVCVDALNFLVFNFNRILHRRINELGSKLPGATFIIGNNFDHMVNLVQNPTSLGLKEGFKPCCKLTKLGKCDAKTLPCKERNDYAFFDGFNPTQAANKVLAIECFNGTSGVCSPINVRQLVAL